MKSKTVFICKQCGNETPRWQGQCPACGAWNSIIEFEDKKTPAAKAAGRSGLSRSAPKKLKEVTGEQEIRFSTGMHELDRVLGGGGVRGSLILVGGAPGIGKSTLLLQICAYLGKRCGSSMSPARNRKSRSSCAPTVCRSRRTSCTSSRKPI